jgi:hypothetical protein
MHGNVMIFNARNKGLQLVVLDTFARILIALFCKRKTFLQFLEIPQNKIPYFKTGQKYAKYIILATLSSIRFLDVLSVE